MNAHNPLSLHCSPHLSPNTPWAPCLDAPCPLPSTPLLCGSHSFIQTESIHYSESDQSDFILPSLEPRISPSPTYILYHLTLACSQLPFPHSTPVTCHQQPLPGLLQPNPAWSFCVPVHYPCSRQDLPSFTKCLKRKIQIKL